MEDSVAMLRAASWGGGRGVVGGKDAMIDDVYVDGCCVMLKRWGTFLINDDDGSWTLGPLLSDAYW